MTRASLIQPPDIQFDLCAYFNSATEKPHRLTLKKLNQAHSHAVIVCEQTNHHHVLCWLEQIGVPTLLIFPLEHRQVGTWLFLWPESVAESLCVVHLIMFICWFWLCIWLWHYLSIVHVLPCNFGDSLMILWTKFVIAFVFMRCML